MKISVLTVLAALSASSVALADDGWKVWSAGEPMFTKGTQALTLDGGYDYRITNDDVNWSQVALGYEYYFVDNLSIVPKIRGYVADTGAESGVLGADFDLGFRWHFWRVENFSFFAGIAGGLTYFDHDVPVGTTNFNFMAEGSLGLTYKLAENLHFVGGMNIQHFSNGRLAGGDRHDGCNALGGFAGLMWTF